MDAAASKKNPSQNTPKKKGDRSGPRPERRGETASRRKKAAAHI